ncbi:hypothetical protein [Chryseobacterium gregarium]|uniref:hypothetical protein n=1 Tax=Chryseobacterium gregarium TaxID=456299 RepID=UPI000488DCE2|nr:hypothetical protein [Chryseobacterium gregarium]
MEILELLLLSGHESYTLISYEIRYCTKFRTAKNRGGYISKEERFDVMQYYDFDPADYFEPDYGND